MAACSRHCKSSILHIAFSLLALAFSARAKEYTVGDSSGWNLGVDYVAWASPYTFNLGDSLKFSYPGGLHSVQQVSDEDYKGCNGANAIFSGTSGNTVVKLNKAGTYNFICGVVVHCQGGMKLSVTISDKATSSSASAPTPIVAPTKHASPPSTTATTNTTTTSNPTSVAPTTSLPSSPSTPSSPSNLSKSSPLPHQPTPSFLIISLLLIIFSTFV